MLSLLALAFAKGCAHIDIFENVGVFHRVVLYRRRPLRSYMLSLVATFAPLASMRLKQPHCKTETFKCLYYKISRSKPINIRYIALSDNARKSYIVLVIGILLCLSPLFSCQLNLQYPLLSYLVLQAVILSIKV